MILRWGYIPNEIRAAVRPILVDYLWLVPPWVRLLGVRFTHEHHSRNSFVNASSDADHEYRQGSIWVHAPWLESNATQRRLDIIHEVLHIPTAPMVFEHEATINRFFDDSDAEKLKATLKEQWRQRFEGTVQDLAYAVLSLPGPFPQPAFTEEEDEP